MKARVAIYETHARATRAVKNLAKRHFPLSKVTLVGKAEIVDDNIHLASNFKTRFGPGLVAVAAGIIVGFLTGIGAFVVPGMKFLYGTGALIGSMAGLQAGLIIGLVITAIVLLIVKKRYSLEFKEHINEGRFSVIVDGTLDDVNKAEKILHTEGTHLKFV